MDSDQDDDFTARDNNSQQDNVSQDMFDDEDLSNHNAAAIDSIVERMEDVNAMNNYFISSVNGRLCYELTR